MAGVARARSRHAAALKAHHKRQAAGLGEGWKPRELRHSFVSILSASDVPLEDISHLVGHVSTTAMDKIFKKKHKTA
jgi:site-specific recombinase XerD